MSGMKYSLFILFLLLASFAGTSFAQTGAGRVYNPATETTVKGTVEKVTDVGGRGSWTGLHLTLRTDGPVHEVHLGPSAYVRQKGFHFAAGDQVEVTGSKVNLSGTETIIARDIKKDGKVLTLRDSQGVPEWSGGRRR